MSLSKPKTFAILAFLFVLTVSLTGCFGGDGGGVDTYNLTMHIRGQGSTSPSTGVHSYSPDESVTLQAFPDDGFEFSHWEGDVSGSASTTTIVMNRDKTATAVFDEIEDDDDEAGEGWYYGDYFRIWSPWGCYPQAPYPWRVICPTPYWQGFCGVMFENIGWHIGEGEFRYMMEEVEYIYRQEPGITVEDTEPTYLDGQPAHMLEMELHEEEDEEVYYMLPENQDMEMEKQKIPGAISLDEEELLVRPTPGTKMIIVITYRGPRLFYIVFINQDPYYYDNYRRTFLDSVLPTFEFEQ